MIDSLEKVKIIFEKAASRIEALSPGDRIPITSLSETIANEMGIQQGTLTIYHILNILLDGYPGVVRKAGSKGGIVKLPVS